MPAYIVLRKFTQQGLSNIKDMPERFRQARANAEKSGNRVIGVWVTMGEYDLVTIAESPDDQTMAANVLATQRAGNTTSQTLRAFSEEEFAQIVAKLP